MDRNQILRDRIEQLKYHNKEHYELYKSFPTILISIMGIYITILIFSINRAYSTMNISDFLTVIQLFLNGLIGFILFGIVMIIIFHGYQKKDVLIKKNYKLLIPNRKSMMK